MTESWFRDKIAELGVAIETLDFLMLGMELAEDVFPQYPTMRSIAMDMGISLGSAQHRVATLRRLGYVHPGNREHSGVRLTNEGYAMALSLHPKHIHTGDKFDVKNPVDV